MRLAKIDGRPDCVIPNQAAYLDASFPSEKLFIIGAKTTCKDRWRQVLQEGKRIPNKHLLTIQPGISSNQLAEMRESNITLIVPKPLHSRYPPVAGMHILTIDEFVTITHRTLEN